MTRGVDDVEAPDGLSRAVVEAAAWRVRLTEAGCDTSEGFEAWIAASRLHEQAWRQVGETWDLFSEHAIAPEIMNVRRQALERASQAHANRTRVSALRSRVDRRWAMGLGAVAAAIALAIGAWGWTRPQDYTTALGERRVLKLEDGSTVTMDSNSVLKVSLRSDARDLELVRGQARFDVAHDASRPFSVHVRDQTVVATGTSFDVDLLDKTVFVTLIQGHVSVFEEHRGLLALPQATTRLVAKLEPGDRLTSVPAPADGAMLPVAVARGVSVDQMTAWQGGKLIFSDEPLSLVAARVSRYSVRQIAVDGTARSLKLSGVFDVGDAGSFVDAVQRLLPIAASTSADGVIHLQHKDGPES